MSPHYSFLIPPERSHELAHQTYPPLAVTATCSGLQPSNVGNVVKTSVSTSTLSAPFSASREASPMALRSTTAPMETEYNPQDWYRRTMTGPLWPHMAPPSATTTAARQISGMEALLPSPPPAYSPPAAQTSFQNIYASSNSARRPLPSAHTSSSSSSPNANPPTSSTAASTSSSPLAIYHCGRLGSSNAAPPLGLDNLSTIHFPPPPPRSQHDRSVSRPGRFTLLGLTPRNRTSDSGTTVTEAKHQHQASTEARASTCGLGPGVSASRPTTATLPSQGLRFEAIPSSYSPSARRASSAGAIATSGVRSRRSVGSESFAETERWRNGSTLPPPPPGPPPNLRSQSSSRASDFYALTSDVFVSGAIPLRHHVTGSVLGPIPPTPVDWRDDEGGRSNEGRPGLMGFYSSPAVTSSSMGAPHEPAPREQGVRGIRERRSESRVTRKTVQQVQTPEEPSNRLSGEEVGSAKPANLVLNQSNTTLLARRPAVTRSTHGSGKGVQLPEHNMDSPRVVNSMKSMAATQSVKPVWAPQQLVPTPPFSPGGLQQQQWQQKRSPSSFASRTLPTPPPQSAEVDVASWQPLSRFDRPCSHILNTPNRERNMPAPLAPLRAISSTHATGSTSFADGAAFAQACIERHCRFVESELAAATDRERLGLFADFMVSESKLRRDRYSGAFDSMASDILESTRDLWRSPANNPQSITPRSSESATKHPSLPDTTSRESEESSLDSGPFVKADVSATSSPNWTPKTEPNCSGGIRGQSRSRPDTNWTNGFNPVLSPIPSMAVSTAPDEESCRGRSASRWWESSGEGSVGGARMVQRSKRESKYMSLPRESGEMLHNATFQVSTVAGESLGIAEHSSNYGPDAYPPEKIRLREAQTPQGYVVTRPRSFGCDDKDFLAASRSSDLQGYQTVKDCTTRPPHRTKLDVSRLVTLPPSHPRHHPAVNNSHPDLQSIRNDVRMLSDLTMSAELKAAFASSKENLDTLQNVNQRKQLLRLEIQESIRSGSMSFAEAAKLETNFDTQETKCSKDQAQDILDGFQKQVMSPLHALLSERIIRASADIEDLRSRLSNDAQQQSPNQAQEEGDEQPELLERLTLLKWLFEAREELHRELYELEGLRNNHYKKVVLIPYLLHGEPDKIRDVERFFVTDNRHRQLAFEKAALRRVEEFLEVIEENVTRGVEVQLGAFWDIAPALLAVVQKIPTDLSGFEPLIPEEEYRESPSYRDFPMQYLYTLLVHAGESAYQFIESQTNLLCLLHEIKTGVLVSETRLTETQRLLAGEEKAIVETEIRELREGQEAVLTADLKEKVGLVEEQWREALGSELEECRDRVERHLHDRGGWDDAFAD